MARINVEDTIYQDYRFCELIGKMGGDMDKALGCLVRAWTVAQRWYLKPCKWIPLKEWNDRRLPLAIVEVGLAEVIDDLVRMRGVDEQFAWLKQRSEAGKKGGLKSQVNSVNGRQSTDDDRQASSSYSYSKTKNTTKPTDVGPTLPPLARVWNQHRGALAEVKASNASRERKAHARWKENPNPEYWSQVVQRISKSSFCAGNNDRGWRATFDWLLQPETHLKVMEGKYRGKDEQNLDEMKRRRELDEQIEAEIAADKQRQIEEMG